MIIMPHLFGSIMLMHICSRLLLRPENHAKCCWLMNTKTAQIEQHASNTEEFTPAELTAKPPFLTGSQTAQCTMYSPSEHI
jgi:hypothetical protein